MLTFFFFIFVFFSVYHDWTNGMAGSTSLALAPKGSLGEWLETRASLLEKQNFFRLMNTLGALENQLGLQQNRDADVTSANNDLTIQLGSKLKVGMRFITE